MSLKINNLNIRKNLKNNIIILNKNSFKSLYDSIKINKKSKIKKNINIKSLNVKINKSNIELKKDLKNKIWKDYWNKSNNCLKYYIKNKNKREEISTNKLLEKNKILFENCRNNMNHLLDKYDQIIKNKHKKSLYLYNKKYNDFHKKFN